jgi:hypothetical protein
MREQVAAVSPAPPNAPDLPPTRAITVVQCAAAVLLDQRAIGPKDHFTTWRNRDTLSYKASRRQHRMNRGHLKEVAFGATYLVRAVRMRPRRTYNTV